MDRFTKEKRSEIMKAVKNKNTRPEIIVRKIVFSLGYRFRLHRKDLPGTPDLVFPARKKVIFVHGCFWHGHQCSKGRLPKSEIPYWEEKLSKNKSRDKKVRRSLFQLGWKSLVIWQCELKRPQLVKRKINIFLGKC